MHTHMIDAATFLSQVVLARTATSFETGSFMAVVVAALVDVVVVTVTDAIDVVVTVDNLKRRNGVDNNVGHTENALLCAIAARDTERKWLSTPSDSDVIFRHKTKTSDISE